MKGALQEMFNLQKALMVSLGVLRGPQAVSSDLKPELAAEYNEAASGLVCEAAEVLELVAKMTKPWNARLVESAQERRKAIIEEVVDVLFYAFELLILLGVDENMLLLKFKQKQAIVQARIIKSRFTYEQRVAAFAIKGSNSEFEMIMTRLMNAAAIFSLDHRSFCFDPVQYVERLFNGD